MSLLRDVFQGLHKPGTLRAVKATVRSASLFIKSYILYSTEMVTANPDQ